MTGIYFYLQILFAIVLLWAWAAAIYMGIFHAHRPQVSTGRKHLSAVVSTLCSGIICFFMYSWSYLSW
ncbi:MAG: hypothetical protein J5855_00980 [Mailhella sp.]|nr:hypothetical protein [Mailhella sp.]